MAEQLTWQDLHETKRNLQSAIVLALCKKSTRCRALHFHQRIASFTIGARLKASGHTKYCETGGEFLESVCCDHFFPTKNIAIVHDTECKIRRQLVSEGNHSEHSMLGKSVKNQNQGKIISPAKNYTPRAKILEIIH